MPTANWGGHGWRTRTRWVTPGYVITGSGGGGSGGSYVFASLDELDGIIAQWTEIRDAIQSDGQGMTQANFLKFAPAEDEMSRTQSSAVSDSMEKARQHNQAMFDYAVSYIAKLAAARKQYVNDDESAFARLERADET